MDLVEANMQSRVEAAFCAAIVGGIMLGFVIGFYVFIIALNTPRGY